MSRICRSISVLIVVLLLCITVQAQGEGPGLTGKGLKVGMGWASLSSNSDVFDVSSRGGFTAGVYLTYSISPKLSIQPELLYLGKGATEGDGLGLYAYGYKFDYLEIPVLLKYKLVENARMQPSLYMGPAASFLLKAETYQEGAFSFRDYESDIKDGMKSMDFNLVFGGEIEFRSSKRVKLLLDVRYSIGLANSVDPAEWNDNRKIVDEGDWGIIHWIYYDRPLLEDNASVKNQMFTLMIGVRF